MFTFTENYNARTDLNKYGSNALLMYALQMRFNIDDIESVASESLTDGPEDKKCDMIYVDSNEGIAIIAQAYLRQKEYIPGSRAKLTKAQDLNTAAGWILGRDMSEVPEDLKNAAGLLKSAIEHNEISTIYFWYLHNCDETPEIANELKTVESTARALLINLYPESNIIIMASEIGNQTLDQWYRNSTNQIMVNDEIKIPLFCGSFELSGTQWKACQAYIKGEQLKELFSVHKDNLFSANPRRFLGMGKRTNVINLGIKSSAEKDAENFWVYNNGITALVHSYEVKDSTLIIHGISIINGAQTTGSLGSLSGALPDNLIVSLRVIVCSDESTIEKIIQNNNKQNEMLPSDFRSNDHCQSRLREEFARYPGIYYSGGQRNNTRYRGTKEVFDPNTVAQILVAFNGNPVDAYSNTKRIWNDDKLYGSVFNDSLTPEHIIFAYSLIKAIDNIKFNLQEKKKNGSIRNDEIEYSDFLARRGARILLLSAIAFSLEAIIDRKIINKSAICFKDNSKFDACVKLWEPIIAMVLAFCSKLFPALSAGGLDNKEKAAQTLKDINELINAIHGSCYEISSAFSSQLSF